MDLNKIRFQIEQFTLLGGASDFFRLRSGEAYQGWIEEVGETTLSFTSGGAMSGNEPFEVPLAEIDMESFAYLTGEPLKWTEVVWTDRYHWQDR